MAAEPGLCALARAGDSQVRPQHLSLQTHPAGRPASRWPCPGRLGLPDRSLNRLERSKSLPPVPRPNYLLLRPNTQTLQF